MQIMKLDRFLVSATRYSRRDVYDLVTEGHVFVNGKPASDMTVHIRVGYDQVRVLGESVVFTGRFYYFKFYKPVGVLSTLGDPRGRLDLSGYLSKMPEGVFPVGRLDRKSSGLLLVTNDGVFANTLLHPTFKLPKTYRVVLDKNIRMPDTDALVRGFFLEDGPVRFDRVSVLDKRTLDVVISEGRNRIVRRSFAHLGYELEKLHRMAIGPILLAGLLPGQYKALSDTEITAIGRKDLV